MRFSVTVRLSAVAALAALLLVPSAAAAAPQQQASPSPADQRAGDVPPQRADLQRALDAIVAAGAPSVIVEVRDEHGVWRGESGVAEIGSKRPLMSEGRFRIGSVTKTFVATLVLQLVGEGKVELDAPVERYLPGIIPGDQGITVRQLLNHTSGIYDYDVELLGGRTLEEFRENVLRTGNTTYRPKDLVRLAMRHEPEYQPGPGERWYSNTNYILLGLLIEEVTGHDVRSEVLRRIIIPLRLHHTRFPETRSRILGPNANGYEPLYGPGAPLIDVTTYNPSWAWTAGAITSTTSDLNRFFRALLTGELLPPDLLAEMQQTTPLPVTGTPYGLGLLAVRLGAVPGCSGPEMLWGHDGIVPGYMTLSLSSPDGEEQLTLSRARSWGLPLEARQAQNAAILEVFCDDGAAPQPAKPGNGSGQVLPPLQPTLPPGVRR